jgi:hypothetical protein
MFSIPKNFDDSKGEKEEVQKPKPQHPIDTVSMRENLV